MSPVELQLAKSAFRVLLVDDEAGITSVMREVVAASGYTCVTASSGAEAIQLFAAQPFQFVVSDIRMPEMTDIQMAETIVDTSPKTVRILLSGFSDMNAILRALNKGEVFRFMLKPWVDVDLKAAVHLALAHYRLLEQNEELLASKTSLQHLVQLLSSRYPDIYKELHAICAAEQSAEMKIEESVPA